MGKISNIDLIGVPWPVSLLQCYRQAHQMRPGDQLVVTVEDRDIKESLVLILKTQPEHGFQVTRTAECYEITVFRTPSLVSAEENDSVGRAKKYVSS